MDILFKQLEKFLPLNDSIIEDFNSKIQVKHYQKRDDVFEAGNVCNEVYFVSRGLLRVFTRVEDREITTDFVEDGKMITIIESFYTDKPSQKSIVAEQNSKVLILSKKDFYTLAKKYQGFTEFIFDSNEQKFMSYKHRELNLLSMDSEELYLDFVANNPELYKKIKGKDLSTYLNMTQETASRIKKKNNLTKN